MNIKDAAFTLSWKSINTDVKLYKYNYSEWVELSIIIHERKD